MRTSLLLALTLLAGCATHRPSEQPLSPAAFREVYADMEATLWGVKRVTGDTAIISRAADSVLTAHGTTRARYLATMRWFNNDGERWRGFYDSVGKILEERARKVVVRKDTVAAKDSLSGPR